jgi:hypothetical protein
VDGWKRHGAGGGLLVVRAVFARATLLRLIPLRGTSAFAKASARQAAALRDWPTLQFFNRKAFDDQNEEDF